MPEYENFDARAPPKMNKDWALSNFYLFLSAELNNKKPKDAHKFK